MYIYIYTYPRRFVKGIFEKCIQSAPWVPKPLLQSAPLYNSLMAWFLALKPCGMIFCAIFCYFQLNSLKYP